MAEAQAGGSAGAERVEIFEVGPRDGLQNEPRAIPTSEKIALVDALSACGFRRIEVASFVSPKWVPQMADGAKVLAGIGRRPRVTYAALAPNLRGYEAALAAGAGEIAVFVSASEGFSKANLNCTVAESLARLAPIAEAAGRDGMRLRGYVSMVVDCPFDGPTPPGAVARVAAALRDLAAPRSRSAIRWGAPRPKASMRCWRRFWTRCRPTVLPPTAMTRRAGRCR